MVMMMIMDDDDDDDDNNNYDNDDDNDHDNNNCGYSEKKLTFVIWITSNSYDISKNEASS